MSVQPGQRRAREPEPLVYEPQQAGLLTDLYELTMIAGYWSAGLTDRVATFDLFVRRLPPRRNFLIYAGLEQAIHYLTNLKFSAEQLDYLRRLEQFRHVPAEWFDWLARLGFSGEVWSIPEGTAVFAGEPLLRVTAPLAEAQLVETFLLSVIGYQTSVATKAARLSIAAGGRPLVDFGSRRAHGPQAGMLAARAAYIGGCIGTSNTEAARLLGIPPFGTMAHSWVMAFEQEQESFRQFARLFPNSTFLIDTYDTLQGARHAIGCGAKPAAVRLDSGDLAAEGRRVRSELDAAGWHEVKLFGSGDLNEYRIRDLLVAGAPFDAFGVGTELVTVADAPHLGVVYKLVELSGPTGPAGRIKLSEGKQTWPGRKQVFRQYDASGMLLHDLVGLADESLPGEPLLKQVLVEGDLVEPLPSLQQIQERCRQQLERLPAELRDLEQQADCEVKPSERLEAEFERIRFTVEHVGR